MVNDQIYYKSVEAVTAEIDESAILGYTKSYTDTFPKKNGETNFNRELSMPYAKAEEGIAVLIENVDNPYEYVKAVQEKHDDSKIKFSNDYYDTLGLERPDGSDNEIQHVEFATVTFSFVKREK